MTARRLDSKDLAAGLRAQAADAVAAVAAEGTAVRLAIVIATQDESAAWYVRSLTAAAARVGIESEIADLGAAAAQSDRDGAIEAVGRRSGARDHPADPGARGN